MSGHEHVMPSADGTTGREILTDYGRLIVSECDDGDIPRRRPFRSALGAGTGGHAMTGSTVAAVLFAVTDAVVFAATSTVAGRLRGHLARLTAGGEAS